MTHRPSVQLHERARWVFEHLPERCDRLLDAGCHDGAYTAAFASRARQTVGVDLDAAAVRAGARRHGLQLAVADTARLPFRDGSFDCVVFSEVLEHVPASDEMICIAEIRRVMSRGGTLILTTPHRGSYWWLDPLMQKTHLRSALGAIRGRKVSLKGHKHYQLAELRALMEPYFEVVQVSRVGKLLYPLAYWGYLVPWIGRNPWCVRVWQTMMDRDYLVEHGVHAYNACIVARAR